MFIKRKSENKFGRSGSLLFAVVLFGAVALMFVVAGLMTPGTEPVAGALAYCDAESVDGEWFTSDGQQFKGGAYQSADRSVSGSYSCKLGQDRIYGMEYNIKDPRPGQVYKASVWMFRTSGNRGRLAVASTGDEKFYMEESLPAFRQDDGWELLSLIFRVPQSGLSGLKVYVYVGPNEGNTYFDDLRIEMLDQRIYRPDSLHGALSTLGIRMDPKDVRKVEKKKWEAVATGILIAEDDDWVKVKLETANNEIPARARLKGDWLDHVMGDKWSLRIKVKDPYAWNRLITFSIQSPATRLHLREWLYHKYLEAADVLTPRYDFIQVTLNDKDLGVYAYEEHFDKQIVESKSRREGPILKYAEDGFWQGYKQQVDLYGDELLTDRLENAYWQSEIKPFKESRTTASPSLVEQYNRAQNLLHAFKYGEADAQDVFDLELAARYFAITDLHTAYHGMAWHNVRYYYNPVTGKLEPIGFDGYGVHEPKLHRNKPFLGYYAVPEEGEQLFYSLIENEEFVRKYYAALAHYTDPAWSKLISAELAEDLEIRQNFLLPEFPESQLDADVLAKRARQIRYYLIPQSGSSMAARTIQVDGQYKTVRLTNHFHLALEASGFMGSDAETVKPLESKVYIPVQARNRTPYHVDVVVPAYAEHVTFHLAGVDSLFSTPISSLNASSEEYVVLDPVEGQGIQQYDWITITGNQAIVRAGSHEISEDVVFPKGMRVMIEPGVRVNITNSAKWLVQGPVVAIGLADQRIRFYSSDQSASGFTVMQAGDQSELQYVDFDGLNTVRDPGRTLTGAVTFYESDVILRNCSISNNRCEDALNTIRSKIDIDGMVITNTLFDAYDSDFCEGVVRSVKFNNVSNDALDFSGSAILVQHCAADGVGDKGISVGEESFIRVDYAELSNCNIGLASKDLSRLEVNRVVLTSCNQGFTAYQKKPEFGPAKMVIRNYSATDVDQLYLIEEGSKLELEGRKVEGI